MTTKQNPRTTEEAILIYKNVRETLARQPTRKEFEQHTGISQQRLEKLFGSNSWSKLTAGAGDEPREGVGTKVAKTDAELLEVYGSALRQLGKTPTRADWAFHDFRPTAAIYEHRFQRWSQVPLRFYEYAKNVAEWADVLTLVALPGPTKALEAIAANEADQIQSSKSHLLFVPPIISNLISLSLDGENKSFEFEQKVNTAFQILGFQMERLGQGSGRNPDGIACPPHDDYAIILDAKSRKDGYSLGTDDRAFKEYIEKNRRRLENKRKIKTLYLAIVSSGFKSASKTAIDEIKREGVTTVLITAEQLLKVVAVKIERPLSFSLHEFQNQLLLDGGILKDKLVDQFVKSIS